MAEAPALTTHQKALAVNLDPAPYGTFAEIGAGQEVARWFFQVGGAAGTIAKTISAYDMTVSNASYGRTERYVSRQRLEAMLAAEYRLLEEELGPARGERTAFFVFADTVATASYSHPGDGQGWLGLRFQHAPGAPPSEAILHVVLHDHEAVRQQDALGVLGVNFVHAVLYRRDDPAALITALRDGLGRDRVEIDMIKLGGPGFLGVDNRLMALQLVEQDFTDAVMFDAGGEVVQPSEVLHKRPILIERGSFRPVTNVTLDILEKARAQFIADEGTAGAHPAVLMEMTLRNLVGDGTLDHRDFLARVDTIQALGHGVLVSHFARFFRLADYLTRYSTAPIGIALGLRSLREIVDDTYYQDLPGGVVESIGRLFKHGVRVYVYPMRDAATGRVVGTGELELPGPLRHLKAFLVEGRHVVPIRDWNESLLAIDTRDVRERIERRDPTWRTMVPPAVAAVIERDRLFGFSG